MASIRLVQTIFGYLIPFIIILIFLFTAEWFIELFLGILAYTLGSPLRPNFPGPTDVMRAAIGQFPDIWDLGTALYFGVLGEATYLLYVIIMILAGITSNTALSRLGLNLFQIASDALLRSKERFGAIGTYSMPSDDTPPKPAPPPDEQGDIPTPEGG